MKLYPPTAVNALKILQQNGYLILTDETDNPPRIRFIVQRDDLYRMRVIRRELDHIITVLLRQYSGLFSDFIPIDEQEIAHLSGYQIEHVRELFKQLWQLHIIRYIPGNRSPILMLTEERLSEENVRIAPESYKLREEIAREHVDAIFRYANNQDKCRSLMIQHYFGEQSATPCGRCDLCLERRKNRTTAPETTNRNQIRTLLLERLKKANLGVKQLAENIPFPIDTILAEISALIEEDKIIEDLNGKLRINR